MELISTRTKLNTEHICHSVNYILNQYAISWHIRWCVAMIERKGTGVCEMTVKHTRVCYWIAQPMKPGVQSSNTSWVCFTVILHIPSPPRNNGACVMIFYITQIPNNDIGQNLIRWYICKYIYLCWVWNIFTNYFKCTEQTTMRPWISWIK